MHTNFDNEYVVICDIVQPYYKAPDGESTSITTDEAYIFKTKDGKYLFMSLLRFALIQPAFTNIVMANEIEVNQTYTEK